MSMVNLSSSPQWEIQLGKHCRARTLIVQPPLIVNGNFTTNLRPQSGFPSSVFALVRLGNENALWVFQWVREK